MLKCAQSADEPTNADLDYESDDQVNELERGLMMCCGCHSEFGCDDNRDI